MKKRVIISKLPKAQSGAELKLSHLRAGIGFNANVMPWPIMAGKMSAPDIGVNSTLNPVPRHTANLEAEKGEVASIPQAGGGGVPSTYKIGGQRHSSGGTPLRLPADSFIYSDTAAMKIKDPTILSQFGMPANKAGFTPADIAKKYDINKFKKVLADPDTDKLQRETAEGMITNYNLKLAKLALLQESMKGFPQGIPLVAMPYIESQQIDPADFAKMNPQEGQEQGPDDTGMAKYGGTTDYFSKKKVVINRLPMAQTGYQATGIDPYANQADLLSPYISPEQKMRTEDVRTLQHASPGDAGTYGDVNGSLDQFLKNNPSYSKHHQEKFGTSYNPKNKEHVKEFQNYYNDNTFNTTYNEAIKRGKTDAEAKKVAQGMVDKFGFDPNAKPGQHKPQAKDAMHGEYTNSRVEIAFNPVAAKVANEAIDKGKVTNDLVKKVTADHLVNPQGAEYTPWWMQDIVKTAHAAGDLWRIKKYQPWQATADVHLPRVAFADPSRELAANAEQTNIMGNNLAQFSGPQQYNSRMAQIHGAGLKGVADTLARYNNINIGLSNQQEAQNAAALNQASQQRAQQATSLYDKYQTVNQNFDNAKNNARDVLVNQFTQGMTNRAYTANLNKMNPNYAVNPLKGGEYYFRNPKAMEAKISPKEDFSTVYNDLMEKNPTLKNDPNKAADIALKLMGKGPTNPDDYWNQYQKNQGITPDQQRYPGT